MPIHDQPKDLETLMDPANKYRIGKVVAQGWEQVPPAAAAAAAGGSTSTTIPRWNWLSGDITDAYCSNKTKHVSRSFLVWAWPAAAAGSAGRTAITTATAVIIFDRVHSTDPAFKKTFLLHTLNKPLITGAENTSVTTTTTTSVEAPAANSTAAAAAAAAAGFEIVSGDGALSGTMLLPTSVSVATIGGPGHEFEAGGQNWPPAMNLNRGDTGVSGQWRLEVSPAEPQETDVFLSVWQPHDAATLRSNGGASAAARLLSWSSGAVVGVQLRERVAVFVAAAAGLANVTSLDLRGDGGIVWCGKRHLF
jgi:hypothetical protein